MNDLLRLMRLKALMLALMFVLAWVMVGRANPLAYYVLSVGALGTDSSETNPDSVYFFWYDNIGETYDSVKATAANDDSLVWFKAVAPTTEGWIGTHVPAFWAQWYWDDEIDRDADVGTVAWSVGFADTLLKDVSATASFDSADASFIADTVDARLTAAHDAGSWTSTASGGGPDTLSLYVYSTADSSGVGGANISLYPNDGGTKLYNYADANGRAQFGLANDTILSYVWLSGWYQAAPVPDTTVCTLAVADTVWMTQVTAASAPSPALTPVTFIFKDLVGDSIKNVELQYNLDTKSHQVYHMDSTKVFDYTTVYSARTDSSGTVTVNVIPNDSLLVEGGRTGQTKWKFQAYEPSTGKKLLGENGLMLEVTASATAHVYPEDF